MTTDLVLVAKHQGVTAVTLGRPELNALSGARCDNVGRNLHNCAMMPDTHVIILTGAGRAFTVGVTSKELGGEAVSKSDAITDRDLGEAVANVGKPVIGAINGFAVTGFEIALMCDFLIASPDARFADTLARVGVVPGMGTLSADCPGLDRPDNRAGRTEFDRQLPPTPKQPAPGGLVNKVVSADELLPTCEQLARDIASTEPVTRAEIRRTVDEGRAATLSEGLAIENTANRAHAKNQRPLPNKWPTPTTNSRSGPRPKRRLDYRSISVCRAPNRSRLLVHDHVQRDRLGIDRASSPRSSKRLRRRAGWRSMSTSLGAMPPLMCTPPRAPTVKARLPAAPPSKPAKVSSV